MARVSTWQAIADKKQAEQASRIPKEWLLPASYSPTGDVTNLTHVPRQCGLLSKRELELTERYDATELLGLLRTGRLKSREVVEAFCKVSLLSFPDTNLNGLERISRLIRSIESSNSPPTHNLPHRTPFPLRLLLGLPTRRPPPPYWQTERTAPWSAYFVERYVQDPWL